MIDLNCRAAVDVTLLSLPYMRRGGRILEICSTSAFQPFSLPERVRPLPNLFFTATAVPCGWNSSARASGSPPSVPTGLKIRSLSQSKRHRGRRGCPPFSPCLPQGDRGKTGSARQPPGPSGVHAGDPYVSCTGSRQKFIPSEIMMGLWALIRRI